MATFLQILSKSGSKAVFSLQTGRILGSTGLVRGVSTKKEDDKNAVELKAQYIHNVPKEKTPLIQVPAETDISPLAETPEELKQRLVKIYSPTRNAMQSGTSGLSVSRKWRLEFDIKERWENPLMGWTSTADPMSNMSIEFGSPEDAAAYCEKNGWTFYIEEKQKPSLRPKSYGANYSWNKRTRVGTK